MEIDKNKCVGCGNCIPWCTMGVIFIGDDSKADVNQEECVECENCYRSLQDGKRNPSIVRFIRKMLGLFNLQYEPPVDECPTSARTPSELEWPRELRKVFSDPTAIHPGTGIGGRGTEEIKTNDVTGRLKEDDVGVDTTRHRQCLCVGPRLMRLAAVLFRESVKQVVARDLECGAGPLTD